MTKFGWTRLAQVTITLAVIALLVKLGSFGLDVARQDFLTSAARFVPVPEQTIPDKDPEDLIGSSELRPDKPREHDHHEHATSEESIYRNVNFSKEAPVFFRPKVKPEKERRATDSDSTAPSGPVNRSSDAKVCKNVNAAPNGARILFPMTRDHFDTYEDTWGAARPQGGHEGTDLMVDDGTPLLAMTDATVVPVSGASSSGWNELGGYTAMVEANYSIGPVKKGDLFYYAHMNRPTKLNVGDVVKVGDVVGYAGDTGQGPEVTTGQFPSHLHLGWYDVSSGRSQLASGAMNPYPLLEWVKANGGSIKGGSDVPYCEAPQSPAPTPSDGGYWQYPTDPGVRPDMDTGGEEAIPTPDARPAPSAESSPNVEQEQQVEVVQNQNGQNQNGQNQNGESGQAIQDEQTSVTQEITDAIQSGTSGQAIPSVSESFGDVADWIGSVVNPRPERPNKPDRPETSETEDPESDKPRPDKPKPGKPRPDRPDKPEATTPDEDRPGGEDDACEAVEDEDEPGAADEQYQNEDGETPDEDPCDDEAASPEADQSGNAAQPPSAGDNAPEAVSDGTEATADETTSP